MRRYYTIAIMLDTRDNSLSSVLQEHSSEEESRKFANESVDLLKGKDIDGILLVKIWAESYQRYRIGIGSSSVG